jgi:adenylate cyclase, class 2
MLARAGVAMRLNREIKAYCPDFEPIRRVLREVEVTFAGRKEQVDYFFVLPDGEGNPRQRRLKLRTDDEGARLIYYYDREEPNSRNVNFEIAEVDAATKELLEAALGVRAIVRKRREIWKQANTRFNLDEVDGVGTIFETEVEGVEGDDSSKQLAGYRELFAPYLGEEIAGSNEDLVGKT